MCLECLEVLKPVASILASKHLDMWFVWSWASDVMFGNIPLNVWGFILLNKYGSARQVQEVAYMGSLVDFNRASHDSGCGPASLFTVAELTYVSIQNIYPFSVKSVFSKENLLCLCFKINF